MKAILKKNEIQSCLFFGNHHDKKRLDDPVLFLTIDQHSDFWVYF